MNTSPPKKKFRVFFYSNPAGSSTLISQHGQGDNHLLNHLMLDDGASIENFHGNTLTSLCVLSKFDLGISSFPNRPPYLILAHFPHHHLSLLEVQFLKWACSILYPEEIFSNGGKTKAFSPFSIYSKHYPETQMVE
uniref:Uncharacterized protein n=1 Tax=Opuntia streptacantha TaxID=393608 RepID=A0A7C9B0M3_OPUST